MGGMGNQMYCYALAKALSLKKGTPLVIDKSWTEEVSGERKLDSFALSHFRLVPKEWNLLKGRALRLFSRRKADRMFLWLSMLLPKRRRCILVETKCTYDDWIMGIKGKTIYIRAGTWQSYKYFQEYEQEIREDFEFRQDVYESNRRIADRIVNDGESVSVHVRRGDYVENPKHSYTQGVCTREYYDRALEFFAKRLKKPTFYFFSDDIAFVKKEFGAPLNHVIVERRERRSTEVGFRDDGYNDMYLMSLCKNNIVANSTFSWWAAYLNRNAGKIVVAPAKWYNDLADDSFIVQPEWIRISG